MRRSLGTAVFSGMLGFTLFGIFLTPVFFHVTQRFFGDKRVALEAPVTPHRSDPPRPMETAIKDLER
jgi:multidrug efflux pump